MKNVPLRTCAACREKKPKTEMLRVVRSPEGDITIDFTGRKNGRGAYICNSEACVKKLRKAKLLNKAFSAPVDDAVYDGIEEAYLAKK
ncbi:MAG: YlxR family protein [Clostridia bacterium]|nr:YlxR family protein [Clostridia bacterium]